MPRRGSVWRGKRVDKIVLRGPWGLIAKRGVVRLVPLHQRPKTK